MTTRAADAAPRVTDRSLKTLRTVVELTAKLGYPPTLAELADVLGLNEPSSVSRRLLSLRAEGFVSYVPGAPRSLRVTNIGARLLADTGGALTAAKSP